MIVVDRIEGTRAVLEVEGELVEVPAAALPAGSREGDVLAFVQQDAAAIRAEGQARLARLAARHALPDDIEL